MLRRATLRNGQLECIVGVTVDAIQRPPDVLVQLLKRRLGLLCHVA